MLKWYLKYFLSAMLGILPFRHKIHSYVQTLTGSGGLDEDEMLSRVIELYSLSLKYRDSLKNANILEIGTGWYPFVPIVACLYGANKVVTVDLNPWLTVKTFKLSLESIIKNKKKIIKNLGEWDNTIEKKLYSLKDKLNENDDIQIYLKQLNIEYLSNYDVCNYNPNNNEKPDLILSSNVLEHIPEKILSKIHNHLSKISTDKCLAVHRFNPADHFANLSGSTISFLSIPNFLWKILGGSGLSYHNRLRTIEHAELAINNFWTIRLWADAIDEKAKNKIQQNKINLLSKYKNMDINTICAFYSWLVLKPGIQSNLPKPKNVKWIADII